MSTNFKEWFAKIQDEPINNIQNSNFYKVHYPFIQDGYSDLLEDSDWDSSIFI